MAAKEDPTPKEKTEVPTLSSLTGNKSESENKVESSKSVKEETAYVYPKDVKPGVDNTKKSLGYATPNELNGETAEQTAKRYGIDDKVSEEDLDNPRVQVYRDTIVNQVPSGTHLHPDVAKDMFNRGISETHTDNAQVRRSVVEVYDFAPNAEHNDKF